MVVTQENRIWKFLKNQAIVLAMIAVFAVFSMLNPQFYSSNNIILILRQVSIVAVMGCGMCFVIIGGNFDLSVGSLLTLCCMICISLHDIIGPIPAMLVTIVIGILSGCLTGFLVGYLRLNSMIVTLGMMNVLQAIALMYSGGQYARLNDPDAWFTQIGKGSVGPVPVVVIIMVITIAVFTILLNKTIYGEYVLSVGSNAEACRFSGINDKKVILLTYVLSGFTTAIGAIMLCSRGGAAELRLGVGYEFDVITGVILGGASLNGGSGSIPKTFIGVLIIGILKNGFVIISLPYYLQWIAQCLIILVAVWLDIRSKRKKGVLAS